MKTLYLNNYKGFTDTFIPFLDVNFLVGENSTGKTSILNLINIISDFNFWFSPNFNNNVVELGYFSEIVNQRNEKKTSFEIGIEFYNKRNKGNFPKYIYVKFDEKENRPHIKVHKFICDKHSITITFFSKSLSYQVSDFNNESFEEWIKQDETKLGKKHRVLLHRTGLSFPLLQSYVYLDIQKKNKDLGILGFFPPHFENELVWLGPIRAKAKRYYEAYKSAFSPEGDHAPTILKRLLSNKEKNSKLIQAIKSFGKESGLFDEIEINDFGKSKDSPFSININYDSLPIRITNVGYGVSQILPILVEILTSQKDALAIQQPEVHLHPRAQAALGELIYYSSQSQKNRFFIETHSEYTINRFRFHSYNSYKSEGPKNPSAQVLFFERTNEGIRVTNLPFNDRGQYPQELPESYTKFFIDEEIKMLEF